MQKSQQQEMKDEKTKIFNLVIDTNVLVSALLSDKKDSATVKLLHKILLGELHLYYNSYIINEYNTVLRREKFSFSESAVYNLIATIEKYGQFVYANEINNELFPDLKDKPFYEVVMEKRKEDAYLVTGNKKHFPIKTFIVTPAEMIDIIEKKEEEL